MMIRPSEPPRIDVVLIGGGHAHVAVLRAFGMRPEPGVRLTLIAAELEAPYSGMLPGLVAGHYRHGEAHIDLQPLARFAGARLIHAAASAIDLAARTVGVPGRPPVAFDLLSLDVGSVPPPVGAADAAIPVKPVPRFLEAWTAVERRVIEAGGAWRIAVVGGGAGGIELALCLRHRVTAALDAAGLPADRFGVTLATDALLPGHGAAVRRRLLAALARRGIAVETGSVDTVTQQGVRFADGRLVAADSVIRATGAAPPGWIAETGLATDAGGFVQVDASLRSTSHRFVFAAGDVAAFAPRPLPKSGVFAVRQGPVLAENLRRAARGEAPDTYRPQRRALALISTGERNAIASWGPLAIEGRWVWRLKDRIDRRWMEKYQHLPQMAAHPDDPASALDMRCGGCGAKVASPVLARVLARLEIPTRPDVLLGIGDDAAVIAPPPGKVLVQTVDQFRSFVDDPFLFGRIAANHCLGDLWAKGAEPHSALALVTLPFAPEPKLEETLYQLLAGALGVLREAGAALVGGHTAEGAELAFGLSLNGFADAERVLLKGGAAPGDALILTRPIGTGVIFAADMRHAAPGHTVDAALAAMQRSNRTAAAIVAAHGAHACTDVTGFGLLGHLIEMLRAGGVDAVLDPGAVPTLPGALALLREGHASSLAPANAAFAAVLAQPAKPIELAVLADPQTAGGLLAAVPAASAADCLAALHAGGDAEAAIVGTVEPRAGLDVRIRLA